MPIMQELLRLRDSGTLNESQAQWFRESKESEELFDLENDPHELINLASNPLYDKKLAELRSELDRWIEQIDDKGFMPESELIESMWPGGRQPITASPIASRSTIDGPISLRSETAGASIGYQLLAEDQELSDSWLVYTTPLTLGSGQTLVAIAHRIGFAPSGTISIN
jgi:hypothetical protein